MLAQRQAWLSVRDAAEYLGVDQQAVRRYISAGLLPAYKQRGNGRLKIKRADIDALMVPETTRAAADHEVQ